METVKEKTEAKLIELLEDYGIARYIDTSNGERHWCEDHHGYLEWDKYSDGRGGCSSYKVTRWMPIPVIPQPPKGVHHA